MKETGCIYTRNNHKIGKTKGCVIPSPVITALFMRIQQQSLGTFHENIMQKDAEICFATLWISTLITRYFTMKNQ